MGTLIAEQTTATAVTATAVTLIDWVNVENSSSHRIIIENTGGGSGNDIDDVMIDESDDGGDTADLDQHAATPAVPIASGASAHKAFTSTAKYLRIRADCAAGEDTTAKAWLLADTLTGRLCTLTDVKNRIGSESGDTANDSVLNDLLRGVSASFDNYCNRIFLLNSLAATEYYNGGGNVIVVKRYPIVSITSVTESADYDWDNETALTANDGYHAIVDKGILRRLAADFYSGVDTVRVVYTGGYVAPGDTVGSGETALPDELREAAIRQCVYEFQRKDQLGVTSVSAMGTSYTRPDSIEFLPSVKKVLNRYKRWV